MQFKGVNNYKSIFSTVLEVSTLLACACPVACYIDYVIQRHIDFSLMLCCLSHEVLSPIFSSPLLFLWFFLHWYFSVWWVPVYFLLCGCSWLALHCCASYGGISSNKVGSPWTLQAPNLHLADAFFNGTIRWIMVGYNYSSCQAPEFGPLCRRIWHIKRIVCSIKFWMFIIFSTVYLILDLCFSAMCCTIQFFGVFLAFQHFLGNKLYIRY